VLPLPLLAFDEEESKKERFPRCNTAAVAPQISRLVSWERPHTPSAASVSLQC